MPAPYWVGDEVPLEFTAEDGDGSGASSCTVDIYDQTNTKVVDGASATVAGSTITYNVAETVTDTAGTYRAVFIVVFTGTVTRRHIIHFLIHDPVLRHFSYGSVQGVESLVGDIVSSRVFTSSTVPSFDTIQGLVDGCAMELNIELKQRGYQVPIRSAEDPEAYEYMVYANNAGASARALSTLPMESYVEPNEEAQGGDRRQMLDREFWHAIRRIQRQQIPATRTQGLFDRVYSGAQTDRDTGETKNPLFTRDMTDYPGSRTLQA